MNDGLHFCDDMFLSDFARAARREWMTGGFPEETNTFLHELTLLHCADEYAAAKI